MRTTLSLFVLLALALPVRAAALDDGLLRQLCDEAAIVRERAFRRLVKDETLEAKAVAGALREGPAGARPALLELAARRKWSELEAPALELARSADPVTAEAAVRALAAFGDATVQRAVKELSEDIEKNPGLAARARRLKALAVQRSVEADLFSKWRRKGGSYEGRFQILERHEWHAQPILLAMLLDVPLEDRFLVLPPARSELATTYQQMLALAELASSQRRGYRTFEPLPVGVHHDDVFELAAQALMDVGDMDLMGEILENLAETLRRADRDAGWQLRPVEKHYAEAIEEVLAAHGRTDLLERQASQLASSVERLEAWARRATGEQRANVLQWYSQDLSRLAGVLHRMREYNASAEMYARAIEVATDIGGEAPAVASYNRACALARAGRSEEAIVQLDASLAADVTDLTREWVAEDGDLRSLHEDPRFAEILKKYFGE